MFSNLGNNSVIYLLDLKGEHKVHSGLIERVTLPRPKYNTFNPSMEMVVDIIAVIDGERREFKSVPNNAIADFGSEAFVLAENKEALNSYVTQLLQNSRNYIDGVEKHKKLVECYEAALHEINPSIKSGIENDKAIETMKQELAVLKEGMQQILASINKSEN